MGAEPTTKTGWRSIYDCAHGTILEVEYGRKQAAI